MPLKGGNEMKLLEHYPENLNVFFDRIGGRYKFEHACEQIEMNKNKPFENFRNFALPIVKNVDLLKQTLFFDHKVENTGKTTRKIVLDYYTGSYDEDYYGKLYLFRLEFHNEINSIDDRILIIDKYEIVSYLDDAKALLQFDTEAELDFSDVFDPSLDVLDVKFSMNKENKGFKET